MALQSGNNTSSSGGANDPHGRTFHEIRNEFERFHPEFESKLLRKFSDLSTRELDICILISCGYNSKDIAEIIHTEPATVDNHRAHIRKKFGLRPGINLHNFLKKL